MVNYSIFIFALEVLCAGLAVCFINKQNLNRKDLITSTNLRSTNLGHQNYNNFNLFLKISSNNFFKNNNLNNGNFSFKSCDKKSSFYIRSFSFLVLQASKLNRLLLSLVKVWRFVKIILNKSITIVKKVSFIILNSLSLLKEKVILLSRKIKLIVSKMKNLYKNFLANSKRVIRFFKTKPDVKSFLRKKNVYVKNNMVLVSKGSLSLQKLY